MPSKNSSSVASANRSPRLPSYCLHRPSGQAVVYLDRRAVYLGPYDKPASHEAYRRIVAEFGAPQRRRVPVIEDGEPVSIAALVEQYLAHAVAYYGSTNEYLHTIKAAVTPLLELFACLAVQDFDAKKLELVRLHRIQQGRKLPRAESKGNKKPAAFVPVTRRYVNRLTTIIVRIFRWGAANKIAPAQLWCELRAVEPLKKNTYPDLPMREGREVKPVTDQHIHAVLRVVSPEIAAMIRLQMLTAMRPDEVTAMRSCDITKEGKLWVYTIGDRAQGGVGHKTDFLDEEGTKKICLGPKAQTILKPFLRGREPSEFLFSPQRSTARRYPKGNAGLRPTERYNDDTYCRAVKRACHRPGVPIWTPNQLRHTSATAIRKRFGLEHSQAVLGHRRIETTQIYAERQTELMRNVAMTTG